MKNLQNKILYNYAALISLFIASIFIGVEPLLLPMFLSSSLFVLFWFTSLFCLFKTAKLPGKTSFSIHLLNVIAVPLTIFILVSVLATAFF